MVDEGLGAWRYVRRGESEDDSGSFGETQRTYGTRCTGKEQSIRTVAGNADCDATEWEVQSR